MKKFFVYPMIAVITIVSTFVALVLVKASKKPDAVKTKPNDENTIKHHKKPVIIDKIREVSKKSASKIKPLIVKITKKLKPKSKIHTK